MAAFIERQGADGDLIAATRTFTTADKALHSTFAKLRGFGRSVFMKDAAARETLGLSGAEPKDQQRFITLVTSLVTHGQDEAHAARLAEKGVTEARLTDLGKKLDAWKTAHQAMVDADAAAIDATANRDAAAKALFDWLAEYKQFARTQFKEQPATLKRLRL